MNVPDPVVSRKQPLALGVWGLLLTSFAVLFFGNRLVPIVDGVDFTPFELAGPPFFLVVIPAAALLLRFRHATAAMVVVLLHAGALIGFIGRFLGTTAAVVAIAAYVSAGLFAAYVAKHAAGSLSNSGHGDVA